MPTSKFRKAMEEREKKIQRKDELELLATKKYVENLGVSWDTVLLDGLSEDELDELIELYDFLKIPRKF